MLNAFYAFQFIKSFVNRKIGEIESNAMMKSEYDTDNDGVVDNAKRLNGNLASYYAKVTDLKNYTAGEQMSITHNLQTNEYVIAANNFGLVLDSSGRLCTPVPTEETDNG